MKIIILVRILWTSGMQKIAIEETKTFMKMGYDVELVFLRIGKNKEDYSEILKDVNYRIMPEHNKSLTKYIWDYITGKFIPDRKGDSTVDFNFLHNYWKNLKDCKNCVLICHDQWAGLAGYYAKSILV